MAIDSTYTLGEQGHKTVTTWAKDLVDLFSIGTKVESNSSRVGVIQFWGKSASKINPGSQARVEIELDGGYDNKADLERKITNLPFRKGRSTIIPHGLDLLNSKIRNPPRQTYVLVLTDGVDDGTDRNLGTINPKPDTLEKEARELRRKNNVTVFAIGFRGTDRRIDEDNLKTIATSDEYFIHDEKLDVALNKTYNKLVEKLCPNIPTRSTPPGEFNPLSPNVADLSLIGVLLSVGK